MICMVLSLHSKSLSVCPKSFSALQFGTTSTHGGGGDTGGVGAEGGGGEGGGDGEGGAEGEGGGSGLGGGGSGFGGGGEGGGLISSGGGGEGDSGVHTPQNMGQIPCMKLSLHASIENWSLISFSIGQFVCVSLHGGGGLGDGDGGGDGGGGEGEGEGGGGEGGGGEGEGGDSLHTAASRSPRYIRSSAGSAA